MLRIALSSPVREAIVQFFEEFGEEEVMPDQLSEDDWETLRKIEKVLGMLAMTTKALESTTSTLDTVLPAMDFILSQLETGRKHYEDDALMGPCFQSGWTKMKKYYELSDNTPVYIAAIILHPALKWRYIEKNWDASWVPKAKEMMQEFWDTKYKPVDTTLPPPSHKPRPKPPPPTSTNEFTLWMYTQQGGTDLSTAPVDEYLLYCQSEVAFPLNARDWWQEPAQQKKYPNLSIMALNILSIPAMSADPERLFSSSKLTITDRRNRAGIELIEALECLKSWFKVKEWQPENQG
jgi:hypothetical protein